MSGDTKLGQDKAANFHRIEFLLLCILGRFYLNNQTALAFLCTRVSKLCQDSCNKLKHVSSYLQSTCCNTLTIGRCTIGNLRSFVDAFYAVHLDITSHTNGVIAWGSGVSLTKCSKQEASAKGSTKAEVTGTSNSLPNNIWAQNFLEKQGYPIYTNILYQDHQSAMEIEWNGKESCGRKSCHIDVKYFL